MIDFFTALWGQISEIWNGIIISAPGWIDYAIEALKGLGIGGIALIILKLIVPALKTINDPTLKKLIELFEMVVTLKSEVQASEARAIVSEEKNATINELLVEYMSLSAQTNSNSRTLTPESKKQYEDLAAKFTALGKHEVAESITEMIADNVVTAEEVVAVANQVPEIAEVLEKTPEEVVTTLASTKRKLKQRR